MIEFWQPNAQGVFNSEYDPRAEEVSAEGFRGLGRAFADETGTSTLRTIVPGQLDVIEGYSPAQQVEAPHIKVGVFARGMVERLYTRLYFPEFSEANAQDPVLQLVDESRRDLLVAQKTEKGYHLDIHVQHVDPAKGTPAFDIVAESYAIITEGHMPYPYSRSTYSGIAGGNTRAHSLIGDEQFLQAIV